MAEQNGMLVVVDNLPAGAAADGWDATSGTTADAAWSGSGAASKIALLKNIAGGAGGTDPASPTVANQGTGGRGWLATIAGLLQLGAQTSAKSASMVPATDLANLEPAGSRINAAAMPIGGVGLTGWLSAIYYQLTQTPAAKNALWYVEQAYGANNVAAGAQTTATTRGAFLAAGASSNYAYYQAALFATQAGTLTIYNSTGGTPVQVASVATVANTTTTLKTPAFGSGFSAQWTNTSGNAASAQLMSGFTTA